MPHQAVGHCRGNVPTHNTNGVMELRKWWVAEWSMMVCANVNA
jgi:hypothetical protein